jgi:transcriptional antiterminator NusG
MAPEADGKQWYAVHVYSGFENRVREHVKNLMDSEEFKGRVFDTLIPTEEVAEIKSGKKSVSTKKMFPGYVIIQMILDDDTWYAIKNTPGVTGFVGPGRRPIAVPEDEIEQILHRMEETEDIPRPRITFERGEWVKVVDGPFLNFKGYIADISEQKGRLKVMLQILMRETPVELDFLQVEKIPNPRE